MRLRAFGDARTGHSRVLRIGLRRVLGERGVALVGPRLFESKQLRHRLQCFAHGSGQLGP